MLRRTWAVARKEMRHIVRNRLTLFLVAVSPAFLLFVLAYVFSLNVDHADLAVLDLSQSRASRDYVASLTSNDALSLAMTVDDYQAVERMLVAGQVDAVLVIPPDFAAHAYVGEPAQVQLLADGSNPIIASQVVAMVSATSSATAIGPHQTAQVSILPFDLRSRVWYNAGLKSLISMVPGLMGVVLALPALALSLSLTREKEVGTLEALMATPLEGTAYLVGKTAAYVLTGLSGLLLSWLVAVAWFQVPFRGDLGLLVLLTVAYFLASMGFSLLVSTWVSSQQTAMFTVMMVFFVPSFFLAGLIDPINRQRPVAVLLALPLPATHYITIARGIFLKGIGLDHLALSGLILLAMGLIALVVSAASFQKRLA